MAHELTHANGRYEFAYTGEAPWHNLGTRLPEAATSDEILKAAGLDWVVESCPVFLEGGIQIPGHVANRRSDTREVLSIVSEDYHVVQNGDSLRFIDDLVGVAQAMYHTAGSIRQGRKVFACAKLPKHLEIVPNDVLDQYLLMVNAHDATAKLHLRFTPIRVVCTNTLGAAMRGRAQWQADVAHVGNVKENLETARRMLGMAERYFEVAGETYKALAATDLDALGFEKFLNGFLPKPSRTEDEYRAERIAKARDAVSTLFEVGLGTDIPGVRGTAWGAYNAGVEWIDRVRTARKDGQLRKGAAETAVFGDAANDLRQAAFDSALALVGRR